MKAGRPSAGIILCLVAACSIADSHRPQWLEAHGHNSLRWIAAAPTGVLGLAANAKILRYPGGWNNPWEEHSSSVEAVQIAATDRAVFLLTADGALMRRADAGGPVEPLTNGGGITRFAVSSSGEVHVLSRGHVQGLIDGRLVDTPCAARDGKALAVGGEGTYVVTTDGKLAVETTAGACQEMSVPFVVADVAASDVKGGLYDLAAVDSRQKAWLRRAGQWEELPLPVAYRAGRFPRSTPVEQVAMSALAFWVRTVDGLVFAFSDPR